MVQHAFGLNAASTAVDRLRIPLRQATYKVKMIRHQAVTEELPLVFLPQVAWQGLFVPTLEGQYIIKNILIAASAVVVGSKLVPIKN